MPEPPTKKPAITVAGRSATVSQGQGSVMPKNDASDVVPANAASKDHHGKDNNVVVVDPIHIILSGGSFVCDRLLQSHDYVSILAAVPPDHAFTHTGPLHASQIVCGAVVLMKTTVASFRRVGRKEIITCRGFKKSGPVIPSRRRGEAQTAVFPFRSHPACTLHLQRYSSEAPFERLMITTFAVQRPAPIDAMGSAERSSGSASTDDLWDVDQFWRVFCLHVTRKTVGGPEDDGEHKLPHSLSALSQRPASLQPPPAAKRRRGGAAADHAPRVVVSTVEREPVLSPSSATSEMALSLASLSARLRGGLPVDTSAIALALLSTAGRFTGEEPVSPFWPRMSITMHHGGAAPPTLDLDSTSNRVISATAGEDASSTTTGYLRNATTASVPHLTHDFNPISVGTAPTRRSPPSSHVAVLDGLRVLPLGMQPPPPPSMSDEHNTYTRNASTVNSNISGLHAPSYSHPTSLAARFGDIVSAQPMLSMPSHLALPDVPRLVTTDNSGGIAQPRTATAQSAVVASQAKEETSEVRPSTESGATVRAAAAAGLPPMRHPDASSPSKNGADICRNMICTPTGTMSAWPCGSIVPGSPLRHVDRSDMRKKMSSGELNLLMETTPNIHSSPMFPVPPPFEAQESEAYIARLAAALKLAGGAEVGTEARLKGVASALEVLSAPLALVRELAQKGAFVPAATLLEVAAVHVTKCASFCPSNEPPTDVGDHTAVSTAFQNASSTSLSLRFWISQVNIASTQAIYYLSVAAALPSPVPRDLNDETMATLQRVVAVSRNRCEGSPTDNSIPTAESGLDPGLAEYILAASSTGQHLLELSCSAKGDLCAAIAALGAAVSSSVGHLRIAAACLAAALRSLNLAHPVREDEFAGRPLAAIAITFMSMAALFVPISESGSQEKVSALSSRPDIGQCVAAVGEYLGMSSNSSNISAGVEVRLSRTVPADIVGDLMHSMTGVPLSAAAISTLTPSCAAHSQNIQQLCGTLSPWTGSLLWCRLCVNIGLDNSAGIIEICDLFAPSIPPTAEIQNEKSVDLCPVAAAALASTFLDPRTEMYRDLHAAVFPSSFEIVRDLARTAPAVTHTWLALAAREAFNNMFTSHPAATLNRIKNCFEQSFSAAVDNVAMATAPRPRGGLPLVMLPVVAILCDLCTDALSREDRSAALGFLGPGAVSAIRVVFDYVAETVNLGDWPGISRRLDALFVALPARIPDNLSQTSNSSDADRS